ncbi:hypothetical protein QNA24_28415 [Rhodococcus qingshengii]|uniref:hypothetical protein n=1 Tax=Rhodococcus qingshengii TaxID=334542 RepID=UPI0024B8C385|nr:hypothetical protein [Rhodococcus qingshengii]MDJ0490306.1 hypothetical protein [Rhodococcus qingshengii]
MTVERYQSVIDTDYHQFMIEAGPLRELIHGQDPDFPLAMFAGDLLRVNVGIKSGPVNVTVEIHESPPLYVDSAWEDSVEGDLDQDANHRVNIVSFWDNMDADGKAADIHGLTPPGERRYRVRIYSRGKNINFDAHHDGDPVEDYLIQMWPTMTAEAPRQIKHTSGR